MSVDGRAPVLVGVGGVVEHVTDPRDGRTAYELMVDAAAAAAEDSGAPGVLGRTDLVLVPRGTWDDRDPGRVVAKRFGAILAPERRRGHRDPAADAPDPRRACAIQSGDADVVLVCGAEAKQRDTLAKRAGIELADVDPSEGEPDEVASPTGEIVTMTEIEREFVMPTHQYSAIEGALGHSEGRGPVESQRPRGRAVGALRRGRRRQRAGLGPARSRCGRDRDARRGQPCRRDAVHEAAVLAVERRPGCGARDGGGRGRDRARGAARPLGVPAPGRGVEPHGPVAAPGCAAPLARVRAGRGGPRAHRRGRRAPGRRGPVQLLPGRGAGAGRARSASRSTGG